MLIGGLVQVGSAANPATAMDGTQTIRLVMFAIGLRFPSFSKALARWLRQIWPPQEASAMSKHEQEQLSTIERIERALVLLAYFIELDGDVHVRAMGLCRILACRSYGPSSCRSSCPAPRPRPADP